MTGGSPAARPLDAREPLSGGAGTPGGSRGPQIGSQHVRRSAAQAHEGVRTRQSSMCLWCHEGVGDDMHLHHRVRRRDLPREALWCGCVLVGLHARCHAAAHAAPEVSVARGIIVPSWQDPREVPVESRWPFRGTVFLTCDLGFCHVATFPVS